MSQKTHRRDTDTEECFLDTVLNNLYDFGEDTGKKRKKNSKTKNGTKCNEERLADSEPVGLDTDSVDIDRAFKSIGVPEQKGKKDVISNFSCSKNSHTGMASPQTVSAKKQAQVEVVMFHNPSKKTASPQAPVSNSKVAEKNEEKKMDTEVFNLEKARLEVHRFGITGYKKEQQRVFEQERAIMLGAKAPKREYVNYKVYQETIKEKRVKEQEVTKTESKSELMKKKKKREQDERTKKKKSGSSILPNGQVGRFKNGTLILSPVEIKKIKSSRVIK
ncbi:uncharacterized protein C1orf131 homolog isoform X2 [Polyodon spathula]|uniref:uncharacterized protein C1orf131 homolog isoform X2 n=1 Tax=Polyodon spathula TaxID=7913 RepID=UPI001B7EDEF5|nr:uncharacterized protein C1orf131 homolog isoform X2 [Polyodon spathula]